MVTNNHSKGGASAMNMTLGSMKAPEPLPEAPASATLRVTLRGYEVLFTLRDHSGRELLTKVSAAIDALEAMGATPAGPKGASVPQAANGAGSLVCPTHGKPLKASQHRPGEFFCTAKIADDDGSGAGRAVYCKYKVKP